ncbi:MAG: glycosyltransferase family A protein [Desulfobulbia bacterium]
MTFQIDKPLPKISSLLVTAGGRYDYFKRSYQCWLDQTYPNRELVIVNEGPVEYQQQIKELIGDRPDVKYIFLDGYYTLGALRNISIALCSGEIFVQWDDDDFNMPDRLAVQYAFLSKHLEAKVCYLTDQLHYYFTTQHLYWNNWERFLSGELIEFSLIPGTIMAYKEGFEFRYPSSGIHASAGEDSILAHDLCEESKVILLRDKGFLHVYSFHGKNVWDVEHHQGISRLRSLGVSHMIKNRSNITRTLDQLKLSDRVEVYGRDGLAFVYEEESC